MAGQHDVDLVVLALAPAYAEVAERLREHCEALGVPACAAATFVEMHFAGLPVLPAPARRDRSGWLTQAARRPAADGGSRPCSADAPRGASVGFVAMRPSRARSRLRSFGHSYVLDRRWRWSLSRCSAASTRPTAWPASRRPTSTCTPSTRATWPATGRPGKTVSLEDLGVEGRSVAVESAALSFVLPWDPLTIGRTMQALFNALCIPATFVLGRQIGLTRSAGGGRRAAAHGRARVPGARLALLDGQPGDVSDAWSTCPRWWRSCRRPALISGVLGLVCLALLLLTKESAAVTFTPFLLLAGGDPAQSPPDRRAGRVYAAWSRRWCWSACVSASACSSRERRAIWRATPLLQKTFGAGPLIFSSAARRDPAHSRLLGAAGHADRSDASSGRAFCGPCWSAWSGWWRRRVIASGTSRPRADPLGAGLDRRDAGLGCRRWSRPRATWRRCGQSDPWVAVAAGGAAGGHRHGRAVPAQCAPPGLGPGAARAGGAGGALGAPGDRGDAESQRGRADVPLADADRAAVRDRGGRRRVGGGGRDGAAGAAGTRSARAAVALVGSLVLVMFWSPLLRERLSSQPLLGRVADRGADPDTPQGLRVEALVQAQPWLQANIEPDDMILTGSASRASWRGTPTSASRAWTT